MNAVDIIDRTIQAQRIMSGVDRRIDEISVLFRTEQELDLLKESVGGKAGNYMRHMRSEVDLMRRLDIGRRGNTGEEFNVRFEFFQIGLVEQFETSPKGAGWRIEAMCVLDGEAPLHRRALAMYGSGSVFHASYKLALTDTERASGNPERLMYDRAVDDLAAHGWRCRALYENSYGRFSYWGDGLPYLKPRCNLRDSSDGADTDSSGTLAGQQ